MALDNVATIGDMQNDLPMFAKSSVSCAMSNASDDVKAGNASDDLKARATHVTETNVHDGFPRAIDVVLQLAPNPVLDEFRPTPLARGPYVISDTFAPG